MLFTPHRGEARKPEQLCAGCAQARAPSCEYGEPDAYDAMLDGKTGLMTALGKGCHEVVPMLDPKLGPRKLDVATMYNTERYRPMYANKRGLPVFLQGAS